MKPSDFARPVEKVPRGWKTTLGWATEWDLTRAYTYSLLAAGVRQKKVKMKKFVIRVGASRRYPVPHYAEV